MSQPTLCRMKKHYDTEFEAEIAAAKLSYWWKEEYVHYPCGDHYHIAHKDPKKWRGTGHKYWRCPKCKQIMKRKNASKHNCNVQ